MKVKTLKLGGPKRIKVSRSKVNDMLNQLVLRFN